MNLKILLYIFILLFFNGCGVSEEGFQAFLKIEGFTWFIIRVIFFIMGVIIVMSTLIDINKKRNLEDPTFAMIENSFPMISGFILIYLGF